MITNFNESKMTKISDQDKKKDKNLTKSKKISKK